MEKYSSISNHDNQGAYGEIQTNAASSTMHEESQDTELYAREQGQARRAPVCFTEDGLWRLFTIMHFA